MSKPELIGLIIISTIFLISFICIFNKKVLLFVWGMFIMSTQFTNIESNQTDYTTPEMDSPVVEVLENQLDDKIPVIIFRTFSVVIACFTLYLILNLTHVIKN